MDILDTCCAHLSNREVLELLRNNMSNKQTNLATIIYETISYLNTTPAATYSMEKMNKFLSQLKEMKLDITKSERLLLLNLKPENESELHVIIDNIEERLQESQREELLNLVSNILCADPDTEKNDYPNKKPKLC